MKVIDHNPDKTIGVVSEVSDVIHIGGFSPQLIAEWAKTIDAMFGDNSVETIHFFVKKSSEGECYALFAAAWGEDPMVALAGQHPRDGSKWGKVYGGQVE